MAAVIVVRVIHAMFNPPMLDERKWPEALGFIRDELQVTYPDAIIDVNDWTQIEYYIDGESAAEELAPLVKLAIAKYDATHR